MILLIFINTSLLLGLKLSSLIFVDVLAVLFLSLPLSLSTLLKNIFWLLRNWGGGMEAIARAGTGQKKRLKNLEFGKGVEDGLLLFTLLSIPF